MDMDPYEHVIEPSWPASPPPPQVPRAVLDSLRTARRRAVWVAAGVVAGQLCTVALTAGAPRVMGVALVGPLNLGLCLVLLQLGLAAWASAWYGRFGRTKLDPLARRWEGRR